MPDVPVPATMVRALAEETLEQLRLATEIEHPGESGRAREQLLTALIQRLVPSSLSSRQGSLLTRSDGRAKQIDVVVYRTEYAPLFEIGGVKHFLIESVVAVVEVKAAINTVASRVFLWLSSSDGHGLHKISRSRATGR